MEIQRPTIAKAILRKKNRTGGVRIPDFKLYKRLQSSKQYVTVQNRNTNQWNKTECHVSIVNSYLAKKASMCKGSLFNKWCWENWTATYKRMKLEHSLTPYTKNELKMD